MIGTSSADIFAAAGMTIVNHKLSEILALGMVAVIPDAVKLNTILQDLYDKLGRISS